MTGFLANFLCFRRHVFQSEFLFCRSKYYKHAFLGWRCKIGANLSSLSTSKGKLFQGSYDIHNALIIDSLENSSHDLTEFKERLTKSLSAWRDEGLKAVWFKVAVPEINWIPVLKEEGFKIHRSHEDSIFLYVWLSKTPCKIPLYPHNMVGAGGVVINDQKQILVVREIFRTFSVWKLPGGYVDPGEDIGQAAVREVFEETGIHTIFDSVLGFRFSPKSVFGCSDLYFVIRLIPMTIDISKQEEEVLDSKWMNIEEFLTHKEVYSVLQNFVKQALNNEKHGVKMKYSSELHPITKAPQLIYSITNDLVEN